MKLPHKSTIAIDKMTRYLLVKQARGDKSEFLARAGYHQENAQQLLEDLRAQLLALDATPLEFRALQSVLRDPRATQWAKRRPVGPAEHLDDRALVGNHKVHYLDPGQGQKMKNKLELYRDAMLTCDVAKHRLKRGDIVKLVDRHLAADGTEGYSIEVF